MAEKLVKQGVPLWGRFIGNNFDPNILDSRNIWSIKTPRFLKKFRLKEWQAFQLWIPGHFVFGAVYNAKISGIVILSVYEIDTGKLLHLSKKVLPWKIRVSKNLFDSVSAVESKSARVEFLNHQGSFEISSNTNAVELRLRGKRKTNSLNVVLPLGKNRSMYSHKALIPVRGILNMGESLVSFDTNNAQLIIDHHKGFYPYNLSYDWATAAWRFNHKLLGFNLTRNQAENPEVYNENCLWVNDEIFKLPDVQFTFSDEFWHIKSNCGSVDVQFFPKVNNSIKFNLWIVAVNYNAPYGTFTGKIKVENQTYTINNAFGVAEKKRYRM